MNAAVQLLAGLLMIAALLALTALVLYILWNVAMIVVSFVPMLGKRHRHSAWDRLNRR